jgi:hypothetical protein
MVRWNSLQIIITGWQVLFLAHFITDFFEEPKMKKIGMGGHRQNG